MRRSWAASRCRASKGADWGRFPRSPWNLNPLAANGFEALKVYDRPSYGGNADGVISEDDLIWSHLRLWVDRNHDGISQPQEIATLRSFDIVAIGLDFSRVDEVDGNGNLHPLQSTFLKRLTRSRLGPRLVPYALHDVYFRVGGD